MASSFKFDTRAFKDPIHMSKKVDKAIAGVCKYWDGPIEAAMRRNAPWTDRTSNARNMLAAQYVNLGGRHGILLTSGAEYGIFLEVRWDGKYAIIRPTLAVYGPKVIKTLTKLLDKLDSAVARGGAA